MSNPMPRFRDRFQDLQDNVERFIRGKPDVVQLALTCLFAGGHLLIEDVPGVAKTSLAKAIAESIRGTFRRIQFTPDLLPSDVTGVDMYNQREGKFEFRPGPAFTNVLLGDEINRASPKTQSALLQIMAENEVTVGLTTHPAHKPFFCVATQNPIEHQGTYMLPEAQLDRFLMRLAVGYPDHAAEMEVVAQGVAGTQPSAVGEVMDVAELAELMGVARRVQASPALTSYLVDIAEVSRGHKSVRLGISPRGVIALAVAAQVVAASNGRQYATPDDVHRVAVPVLAHRILVKQEAKMDGQSAAGLVESFLESVTVPRRA
ncbi:MoxR family ATPase [Lentzea sp. NPDC006480]|uniref:AAA family ATPase n=1 Tax=Lentzea sp. NPDC006480 TaxID=3157176 RepID=UPI0033A6731A